MKDPGIKRRHSITTMQDYRNEPELEEGELQSCFGDDVSFMGYYFKKEEERQGKLEWRAQFNVIEKIVEKQRTTRFEERTRRRDKSSDSYFVHNDLIKTIH